MRQPLSILKSNGYIAWGILFTTLNVLLSAGSLTAQVKQPDSNTLQPKVNARAHSSFLKKGLENGHSFLNKKDSSLKEMAKKKVSLFNDSAKRNQKIREFSKSKLDQLGLKKGMADSIKKSKPIRFKDFSIENSTLLSANNLNFKGVSALNNISVSGQLELFKFPLVIDLSNNSGDLRNVDPLRNSLFKVDFDKSQYQQLYKHELDKLKSFEKMELSGAQVPAYLKRKISEKLKPSSLAGIAGFPKLDALLNSEEQLKALLSLNEDQLKEKLNELMAVSQEQIVPSDLGQIPDTLNKTRDAVNKISDRLDKIPEELNTTVAAQKQKVAELVALKKIEVANEILSLKQKMEESGLDPHRLALIQNFIMNKGSLKDLDAIFKNEMQQQGKLTGVQKFYSRIKDLRAGSFGQQIPGNFVNRDMLIKGFNVTLKTGRGPVNVGLGSNKDVGMPKDAGFDRSMYDAPKLLTYVSIPASNFSFGSGKITWAGAFDRRNANDFNQVSSLPKNGVAFGVSQNADFKTLGKFTFELSKSSVQYKNINVLESDKLVLNNDLKMGNYFRDDVLETISLGVKHGINLKKLGLSGNSFFSYSGIGYQSPGQQGYGNMGFRFGGNVKKNLLKSKLILSMRTDFKNTPISATTDAHWKNYNLQLDGRIKLSKSYSLNLKYAENGVDKVDRTSAGVYSSQKMQVDMNASYKVGNNYGTSYASIGRQVMLNPSALINAASLTNTSFITFIYSQNLIMNAFTLSGNAFYNKEINGVRILGDMLNADAGCQYSPLKNVSLSSSVTYLDNQNIARQLGVRQNIQLAMLKNFDISAFFDIRKNLVSPLYPDLFPAGRGELSIRYYLDK